MVINGAGLDAATSQAKEDGEIPAAKRVAQSWLSDIADVVSMTYQACRTILVATHLDKAMQDGTFHNDHKCLVGLCEELSAAYPRTFLNLVPLFINALDRVDGRTALWTAVCAEAHTLLDQQMVPKFINSCADFMDAYAVDVSKPKWSTQEEVFQLSMMRELTQDQQRSAFASLRKMGYIIQLPSRTIIMKPQWFAAAASVTLSPAPGDNDGSAISLHIPTNPKQPGFIFEDHLQGELLQLTENLPEMQWPVDPNPAVQKDKRLKEASKLIEFLADLNILVKDPRVKVLCHITNFAVFCAYCISAVSLQFTDFPNARTMWVLPALLVRELS